MHNHNLKSNPQLAKVMTSTERVFPVTTHHSVCIIFNLKKIAAILSTQTAT